MVLFMGTLLLIVKKSGATGNNEIVLTNVSQATLDYSYNINVDYIPTITQRLPEISNNQILYSSFGKIIETELKIVF